MIAQKFNDNHSGTMSQALARQAFPFEPMLVGFRGSLAHGTFIPNSDPDSIDDVDLMGVTIAPLSCYMGLDKFEQRETTQSEFDIVTYELTKFIRLLLKSNPNVLSLLWIREDHYLHKSALGSQLVSQRDWFSSRRIYAAFTGYAHGQLKRMTQFQKHGYMGAKRKQLVTRFGYDTKNAAHLIRLLRMGVEFLRDAQLNVYREDAPQLLEIKRGSWTLEKVKNEAERLFRLAEHVRNKSPLPEEPCGDSVRHWLRSAFVNHFHIERPRDFGGMS
jgi:predicted nucleotidyltransferase